MANIYREKLNYNTMAKYFQSNKKKGKIIYVTQRYITYISRGISHISVYNYI